MKFRYNLLVIGSLVILLALYACGSRTEVFTWTKVTATNINTQNQQVIPNNAAVKALDYGIRLTFDIRSLGTRNSSGGAIGRNTAFNDRIDSIHVTSLQNFDTVFVAGKKLNALFTARFSEQQERTLLDTLIRRKRSELLFTQKNEAIESIDFFLTKAPNQTKPMRFLVRVFLNQGRTLRDTTDTVVLQK
ncbi:MAG: hypothetical protein OHK0057_09810 [Thermoflexibacter sp.]